MPATTTTSQEDQSGKVCPPAPRLPFMELLGEPSVLVLPPVWPDETWDASDFVSETESCDSCDHWEDDLPPSWEDEFASFHMSDEGTSCPPAPAPRFGELLGEPPLFLLPPAALKDVGSSQSTECEEDLVRSGPSTTSSDSAGSGAARKRRPVAPLFLQDHCNLDSTASDSDSGDITPETARSPTWKTFLCKAEFHLRLCSPHL
mmetsp:Transcript_14766/g.23269  ORF Transcript_14766/g.23269 Transcript_14766/m.23269 type:complete len:204 (-) Transcript_14766:40-651(-)